MISLYFVYRLLRKNKTQKEIRVPKEELSALHRYNWFSYGGNLIAYFYGAAIIIIINLALSAFYTAIKSDLVKIVGYTVEFLVFTLVISSVILL